jgi:hypothetical protein
VTRLKVARSGNTCAGSGRIVLIGFKERTPF